ncbi:MAG: hypothetical protein ABSH20_25800 [Tepidisphaeraceae bacterium]|jgi:hypothetical protein
MNNNKVLQMFEKNVEWIAMTAGALWVLWVVWAYILTPPSILVAGQNLTPATIDDYIQDNTRASLDKLINSPAVPGEIKAGDYKPNWSLPVPGPIAGVPVGSDPPLKPLLDARDVNPAEQKLVKALPVIPAPTNLGLAMGRCQVTLPPPVLPPVAGAAGAAPAPVVVPVVAPRLPAVPGAMGAAPAGPPTADKNWVCVSALIDPAANTKAFVDAGIAPFLQKQQFVYVQLERVEIKADGTEGKPVIVKELPINVLPDDPNDEKQRDNLMKWLEQQPNQTRVLNPGFYQVASGDLPTPPQPGAVPDANGIAGNNPQLPGNAPNFMVDGKFDAVAALAYLKTLSPKDKQDFKDHLTADQRQLLYKAEQDDKQKDPGTGVRPTTPTPRPTTPTPRPTTPTPRPTTPTPRTRDAIDPDVLHQMLAQAQPPYSRPGRPNPGPGRPYYAPGVPAAPAPVPVGANANGQVPIWQYDETPEPGRSYKYRIHVVMVNPLYRSNMATDDIKDIFVIDGQWSEWSKPVALPASLKWFLVSAASQAEKATFRIIKWEKGKANLSPSLAVSPGEAVGGSDKTSGVDYSTGWTVVDVRQVGGLADRGDTRVTLINERGEILVKRVRQDQKEFEKESASVPSKPSAMAN